MSTSKVKAYIQHIAPIIRAEADRRGYKICSTVIAQGIVEGRYGTSKLAKQYHNHFGMKCGSYWKGKSVNLETKEEHDPGVLTKERADWRVYDNDFAGVSGYYDFISVKRYENLKFAADYRQYAEYLKKDGWATSSTYIQTLCDMVKKYNLYIWDDTDVTGMFFPKCSPDHTSIVQALDEIGVDSSKSNRKKIYNVNFSDTYLFSAKQNTAMLTLLKDGKLLKP